MRSRILGVLGALVVLIACGERIESVQAQTLPDCEWCGAREAPEALDSEITIAPASEPGERLVLEGVVYRSDGETPAPDVIVYAYHTNAEGIYPKRGNETGNAQRHGYLRGWLKTDEAGRYTIDTIRPGSYPGRRAAAHIHMTVLPPGDDEYWISDTVFEDDPNVDEAYRRRAGDRGGSGIIELKKVDGVWHGRRDIVLE